MKISIRHTKHGYFDGDGNAIYNSLELLFNTMEENADKNNQRALEKEIKEALTKAEEAIKSEELTEKKRREERRGRINRDG